MILPCLFAQGVASGAIYWGLGFFFPARLPLSRLSDISDIRHFSIFPLSQLIHTAVCVVAAAFVVTAMQSWLLQLFFVPSKYILLKYPAESPPPRASTEKGYY